MTNKPMSRHHKRGLFSLANTAIALAVTLPFSVAADIAGGESSMFSLRGFGTVGVIHTTENRADFIGTFLQPDGVGHTRSWTASVDSKIGAQLDVRFNDKLSGVVQVVSQYNHEGSYRPQIEWANLSYQVTPDLQVRVGRTVASTFLLSDIRLVGYAHTRIRPPNELYDLMPFTNKDGIDASYTFDVGGALDTLQVSWGKSVRDIPGGGEIVAKQLLDVHNVWEKGPATVRLGYMSTSGDFRSDAMEQLINGFVQFGNTVPGPAGQRALEISRRRYLLDIPYSIVTIGATYDPGDWLVRAEWGKAKPDSFVSDVRSWYLTGAYRMGNVTPYATVADVKAIEVPEELTIPTEGLPLPLAEAASGLNVGLAAVVRAFSWEQRTVSLGIRWDVWTNAALKLQYDRVRTQSGSNGRLINVQPGYRPGEPVDVFSLTLDFVF